MKKDLLEKGAIVQRDQETYAVAPHIPGGITSPATLRKIADVAEQFNAKALKLTSAQRIAIVGIAEDQLDAIWEAVGEKPGAAIGMCVRSVKICPGTTFCKRGQQDSVGVGWSWTRFITAWNCPGNSKSVSRAAPTIVARLASRMSALSVPPRAGMSW